MKLAGSNKCIHDDQERSVALNPYAHCCADDRARECVRSKMPFQAVFGPEKTKQAATGSGGVGPALSRAGAKKIK